MRFYAMERCRAKCSVTFAKVQYDSENLAEGAQIIRSSYVDLLGKEPQGVQYCNSLVKMSYSYLRSLNSHHILARSKEGLKILTTQTRIVT